MEILIFALEKRIFSIKSSATVRDIWNINTKTFYDDVHINTILIDKSNWRQKYNKIKRNIPGRWVNTLKEDTGIPEPTPANLSINQNLMIYSKSKYVEPDKLKLRILHSYLLADYIFKLKSQTKWNTICNKDFDWKKVWRTSLELPCSNKEKQFQWNIIRNAIFTEHRLQLVNFSDGPCHFCRLETEDVRHLFALCTLSKEITRRLQNKMNGIINVQFNCNILLQSRILLQSDTCIQQKT